MGTLRPTGPCFSLPLLRQLLRFHKVAGASHGSTQYGWPVGRLKQAKWCAAVTVAGAKSWAWEFGETMRIGAGSSHLWNRIHWGSETTCLLVEAIRPGYLKALNVVGLSFLTCLCVDIGAVVLEWQTRRGTRRYVPTTEASHSSASPERSMTRYWTVGSSRQLNFKLKMGNVVFFLVVEPWTSSLSLLGCWKGLAQPIYKCFVDPCAFLTPQTFPGSLLHPGIKLLRSHESRQEWWIFDYFF